MKYITTVCLTFALAIGALHLTSCSAFTKDDAKALGAQIAKSALAVATQEVTGEQVNLEAAVALIGLQAASSAIATVNKNLSAPTASPQSIVSSAHDVAQAAISNAAVPDPAIAAKAADIATQAVAAAQIRLSDAGAAPPGK